MFWSQSLILPFLKVPVQSLEEVINQYNQFLLLPSRNYYFPGIYSGEIKPVAEDIR